MPKDWGRVVNPSLYALLRYKGHSAIEAAWNVIRARCGGKAYWYPRRTRERMRRERELESLVMFGDYEGVSDEVVISSIERQHARIRAQLHG